MKSVVSSVMEAGLPPRLLDRLKALEVTVVAIFADGRVQVGDETPWLHRLVLRSPGFIAQLARESQAIEQAAGQAVMTWPGVYLAPLPSRRRRRVVSAHDLPLCHAAVLIGPSFLESEQFHSLCDANQLDHQAALKQAKGLPLVNPAEAQRLAEMIHWMQQDAHELDRRTAELHTMSYQLTDSYEELSLLYKLSTNMTVDQPPEHFLTEACREMQQVLDIRWMALQLTDTEPRLNKLSGKLFMASPNPMDLVQFGRIGRQLMKEGVAASTPRVIDDIRSLHIAGLSQHTSEMLVISLMGEGKPLGILFGGGKIDGSHISSIDSKLCNSLASSMSIFIENMMLYEDMHAMFMGTLHALTNSIDAKDNYTHGHSERVALMSRMLARGAGLDSQTVERVYLAGLVHDVGKIGVPEAVLCKPGKLTEDEFALIRLHPEVGGKILQGIRQMQDLVPGVLYHHERWDGRGYPHNLRGREIPLFGRLIGLADAFDAMSSNRTYRQALDHQQVIEEIRRCAGAQFDPDLVEIFVNLDFAPFYELIRKHQRRVVQDRRITYPPPRLTGHIG